MRNTTYLFGCIAIFGAGLVQADVLPPFFSSIRNLSGVCTTAIYLGDNKTPECGGQLVYNTFKNNRVTFSFLLKGNRYIVLSGEGGAERGSEGYKYKIDSFYEINGSTGHGTDKSESPGECKIKGEIAAPTLVDCVAQAAGKPLHFSFQSK